MTSTVLILSIILFAWWTWWRKPESEKPSAPRPQEDPQVRHMRHALAFAKDQHKALVKKHHEQAEWQRRFGAAKARELDQLSGEEFEEYLAGLFREQGYATELTSATGDYGADLILTRGGQRIAVQAKRYRGSVGVQAVQEALSGQSYYRCNAAWVITTGTFTPNAMELAAKSGVKMIGRSELGHLMAHQTSKAGHG